MKKTLDSDARQRILATADRLFYAEGINSVGIDRIIAEAEVAKMTLYKHFPSKDDLVLAVLKYRDNKVMEYFTETIEQSVKKGKDPLAAFFTALKKWFASPTFRGCIFINTAAEVADPQHAAAVFSTAHKARFHAMLSDIVQRSVGDTGKPFVPAIALLVEGAIVAAVMNSTPNPALVAKNAAMELVGLVH